MEFTQATMQKLHEDITNLIAQYESGILTGLEFIHAITHHVDKPFKGIVMGNLNGLLDVNTGLRYVWE